MLSEQLLNTKFVLEVEKYPCIYNSNLPEHCEKDIVDKAWLDIGKKFKMSRAECKEKWKNIRTVFRRNIKPCKKRYREKRKPYYLSEVMQFILPYITWKSAERKPTTSMDRQTFNTEDSDVEDTGHYATASRPQMLSQSYPEPTPSPQPQPSVPIAYVQSRPEPTPSPLSSISPTPSDLSSFLFTENGLKAKNSVDDELIEYLKTKRARRETNQDLKQQPKKMFLLSLLPDLEDMSDRQMRVFKTRVMQIIEDILDERSPAIATSTTTATPTANNSDVPVYYKTRVKIEKVDDDNFILDN